MLQSWQALVMVMRVVVRGESSLIGKCLRERATCLVDDKGRP